MTTRYLRSPQGFFRRSAMGVKRGLESEPPPPAPIFQFAAFNAQGSPTTGAVRLQFYGDSGMTYMSSSYNNPLRMDLIGSGGGLLRRGDMTWIRDRLETDITTCAGPGTPTPDGVYRGTHSGPGEFDNAFIPGGRLVIYTIDGYTMFPGSVCFSTNYFPRISETYDNPRLLPPATYQIPPTGQITYAVAWAATVQHVSSPGDPRWEITIRVASNATGPFAHLLNTELQLYDSAGAAGPLAGYDTVINAEDVFTRGFPAEDLTGHADFLFGHSSAIKWVIADPANDPAAPYPTFDHVAWRSGGQELYCDVFVASGVDDTVSPRIEHYSRRNWPTFRP